VSATRVAESRAERLERYANDKRFNQIVRAFVNVGVTMFIYVQDAAGVRHRLDPHTASALCNSSIPREAKVEFHKHTTCVWCARLGG
jgi:hypothetical protein